jgi:hypothetical protein
MCCKQNEILCAETSKTAQIPPLPHQNQAVFMPNVLNQCCCYAYFDAGLGLCIEN